MNARDRARSMSRFARVPVETFDRNLKALRERRAAVVPVSGRARRHAPLTLSTDPRTDISPAMLVDRPWLRFYPANVPLDIELNEATLLDFFRDSARRFAGQPSMIYFGQKITYRELEQAVDRFAAGLWDQGVRPGDRVALLLPNCPQFVIAYYGALAVGAIVVPCNPLYVERELEHQLRDAAAKVLVTLTVFFKLVQAVRRKVDLPTVIVGSIKDYFPPALQVVFTVAKEKKEGHRVEISGSGVHNWLEFLSAYQGKSAPPVTIKPDDTALYQYTGGTTGVPKGAMLSHRNLATNARMGWAWMGEGERGQDVTLAAIPFFHVYGMTVAMNLTIFAGGALVIVPRFQPLEVLKIIQRYRPNLFPGVPAMYIALLNHPEVSKFDLSSIEACISGAAPLPLEVAQNFEKLTGAKLVEGFGMTELSPISHGNPLYGLRKEGSIGLPFPAVKARIVDLETGEQVLPVGEIGELVIAGPMVMQGYYNRPDETAKTIRDGWLYSGDIARMDEDGYFYIVDRKKDMILSNGFNVYPRDVEEVLYQHAAVKEAVVIGAPNERGDDTVKAFVVLKEGETATAEDIIEFCRERLTRYKAPRSVEFRTELPKTLIGKHLRRVLVEEEKARLAARSGPLAAADSSPGKVAEVTTSPKTGRKLPEDLARNLSNFSRRVKLPENVHLPKVKFPFGLRPSGKDKAAS